MTFPNPISTATYWLLGFFPYLTYIEDEQKNPLLSLFRRTVHHLPRWIKMFCGTKTRIANLQSPCTGRMPFPVQKGFLLSDANLTGLFCFYFLLNNCLQMLLQIHLQSEHCPQNKCSSYCFLESAESKMILPLSLLLGFIRTAAFMPNN